MIVENLEWRVKMSHQSHKYVELRAYMQMTYVAKYRLMKLADQTFFYNPIPFSTFKEILKENKVVREENVRYVSKMYHEHHGIEMKYGHRELEKKSFPIIERAFEIGLLNKKDLLISEEEWLAYQDSFVCK